MIDFGGETSEEARRRKFLYVYMCDYTCTVFEAALKEPVRNVLLVMPDFLGRSMLDKF